MKVHPVSVPESHRVVVPICPSAARLPPAIQHMIQTMVTSSLTGDTTEMSNDTTEMQEIYDDLLARQQNSVDVIQTLANRICQFLGIALSITQHSFVPTYEAVFLVKSGSDYEDMFKFQFPFDKCLKVGRAGIGNDIEIGRKSP